jgi:phosphoketolase
MKAEALPSDPLYKWDAYWRAANDLSVGRPDLYDKPLTLQGEAKARTLTAAAQIGLPVSHGQHFTIASAFGGAA